MTTTLRPPSLLSLLPSGLPRGPMPTLWHGDGIDAAWDLGEDTLRKCAPLAVQLHTWEPRRIAPEIRRALPGVAFVMGVGIDGIAKEVATGKKSVAWGVAEFVKLAHRAVEIGALAICWNAEAAWKRAPSSGEARRLHELITQGLRRVAEECPALVQCHTAYDHPMYHTAYPWKAWLGPGSPIVASLAQVYAAPGGEVMAHRGALAAREARALSSWRESVRKGWIRADAPEGTPEDLVDVDFLPYFQLHHVPTAATVQQGVTHGMVALWALPSRSDKPGRDALAALCALDRAGYWGADAIVDFQRDHGLAVDGAVGPKTLASIAALAP